MLKYYLPQRCVIRLPTTSARLSKVAIEVKRAHTLCILAEDPFVNDEIFEVIENLDIPERVAISASTTGNGLSHESISRFLQFPRSRLVWLSPDETEEVRHYAFGRKKEQRLMIRHEINTTNLQSIERMVEFAVECRADCIEFDVDQRAVNKHNASLFVEAQRIIMEKARESCIYVSFVRNLCLRFGKAPLWSEISPVVIQGGLVQLKTDL